MDKSVIMNSYKDIIDSVEKSYSLDIADFESEYIGLSDFMPGNFCKIKEALEKGDCKEEGEVNCAAVNAKRTPCWRHQGTHILLRKSENSSPRRW